MKNAFYYLFLAFVLMSLVANAHEEPAKTLKEKKEKSANRSKIVSAGIKSSLLYKYELKEGNVVSESEFLLLKSNYDKNGNICEMILFKSTDSIDVKVVLTYDENNNLITDTDFDADNNILEGIRYSFNQDGLVINQKNLGENGVADSEFEYWRDEKRYTLTMKKILLSGEVEYLLIYQYSESIDEGNNIGITKQTADGKLIMRVENVFDDNGQRLYKKIYDENDKLMYYFSYKYFDNGEFKEISKFGADEVLMTKTVYTLNSDGLQNAISSYNADGKLVSYSEYRYEK
jgi:hypothetical protein